MGRYNDITFDEVQSRLIGATCKTRLTPSAIRRLVVAFLETRNCVRIIKQIRYQVRLIVLLEAIKLGRQIAPHSRANAPHFWLMFCSCCGQASGRELSFVLLGGILLCYLNTFALLAKPMILTCTIQRLGVGTGFSIIYGALLTKTNRISRIFDSASRSAKRPSFISPKSQVVITSCIIGFQVRALIVRQVASRSMAIEIRETLQRCHSIWPVPQLTHSDNKPFPLSMVQRGCWSSSFYERCLQLNCGFEYPSKCCLSTSCFMAVFQLPSSFYLT